MVDGGRQNNSGFSFSALLSPSRQAIPSSLEIHKKIKVTNSHDFHLSTNKIVEWK